LLDRIINWDQRLLVFLNSMGNEQWDFFWIGVTNKYVWIPLYVIILYLLLKHFGWKKTLFTLFFIALLITFTDQFVNLIKETFQRIRPFKDESISSLIRVVKKSGGYSFLSGHATNSFAVSTFVILSLKSYFKPIYFILIWPILFAYSRIYLGVHYPLDVLSAVFLGVFLGFVFQRVSRLIYKRLIF